MFLRHRNPSTSGVFVAAACAGMLALAGCQSAKVAPAAANSPLAPVAPTDACAANLHEISGLLLQYYLIHRDLPATLDEALALADALQPVSGVCPVSKKPYRYDRAGLVAPQETRRVVVMDPEPSHDGGRYALVTVPREANTPLGLWVAKLSETAAQQYHAAAEP